MKSTLTTLLCFAAIGLAAPRALAAPDEVEQLLYGNANTVDDQPLSAPAVADAQHAVAAGSSASAGPAAATYSEQAVWSAPADPSPAVKDPRAGPVADVRDEDQAPAAPISAVPEPSAVILALAALVYFLLFGRRRSV